MITKLTSELKPGDVVSIFGYPRTIASVTPGEVEGLLRVRYEPTKYPGANGGHAEADDVWQVDAPSPLDLAVRRAQELADQYPSGSISNLRPDQPLHQFRVLLDLFRAAR
jgi:hypothetical protein